MRSRERIVVCSLGRIEYRPSWELQQRIQDRLKTAKRRTPPQALPHVVLLVEHPPVYTLGKSGDRSNLLVSEEELARRGATFERIDRGGDITYHGPGQIVGYPILDLDRFYTDIHRYLRELEDIIIATCHSFGVTGDRVEGRTGVWIDRNRKICAMGIRCSRWVTMHGFALNVSTHLSDYDAIVPCGISDAGITSLEKEVGHELEMNDVETELVRGFADRFRADTVHLSGVDASRFLETYLEVPAVVS